jgi:hypothetical protein
MAWAISMPFETFSDTDPLDPPDPAREGETGAAPVKLAAGLDCGSNHHGGHVRVPRERRTGCRAEVGFIHSFTGEGGRGVPRRHFRGSDAGNRHLGAMDLAWACWEEHHGAIMRRGWVILCKAPARRPDFLRGWTGNGRRAGGAAKLGVPTHCAKNAQWMGHPQVCGWFMGGAPAFSPVPKSAGPGHPQLDKVPLETGATRLFTVVPKGDNNKPKKQKSRP